MDNGKNLMFAENLLIVIYALKLKGVMYFAEE